MFPQNSSLFPTFKLTVCTLVSADSHQDGHVIWFPIYLLICMRNFSMAEPCQSRLRSVSARRISSLLALGAQPGSLHQETGLFPTGRNKTGLRGHWDMGPPVGRWEESGKGRELPVSMCLCQHCPQGAQRDRDPKELLMLP